MRQSVHIYHMIEKQIIKLITIILFWQDIKILPTLHDQIQKAKDKIKNWGKIETAFGVEIQNKIKFNTRVIINLHTLPL